MRASFPSMSPTVVLSCASAIRINHGFVKNATSLEGRFTVRQRGIAAFTPPQSFHGENTVVPGGNFTERYCGHGQHTTASLISDRLSKAEASATYSNSWRLGALS